MSEPSIADFHRRTPANRLASLFHATRPAFLSASVLPVLVGLAASWQLQGWLRGGVAALTLLAVGLVHLGANVLNDYCDARSGGDSVNKGRIYPYSGGSRFIQNSIYSEREFLHLAGFLLSAGALCGLALVSIGGPVLLLMGGAGAALAVIYSAPPCLACRGLGDATIAICFGILPIAATIYLQTGAIPPEAWWLGTSVGLFTAAILWINCIPDIDADRWAGKWTLPARLGAERARYGLPVIYLAGIGVLQLSPAAGETGLALIAVLPAGLSVWQLFRGSLVSAIRLTLLSHGCFCLLLIAAFTVL